MQDLVDSLASVQEQAESAIDRFADPNAAATPTRSGRYSKRKEIKALLAENGKDLAEMSLDELRQFSDQITDDVFAVLTLEGSVNARNHIGGTAPAQVRAAVARGKSLLATR